MYLIILLFSFKVVFYNCENLLFSSGHIYEKLTNLSRVIVASGEGEPPAIIGLAEVENDSIMDRWTKRTPLARWNYRYVITKSDDVRGINVALMYQHERFKLIGNESFKVLLPQGSRPTRDILHVWGRIMSGDTLDIFVVHMPSRYGGKKETDNARHIAHQRLRDAMDSLSVERLNANIMVMGDMNDMPTSKMMKKDFAGYYNLMHQLQKDLLREKLEYGSHKYNGEWGFLDHFIVNENLCDSTKGVWVSGARAFALPFMYARDEKRLGQRPKRSRYAFKYEGGYSDHFPITLNLNFHP